MPADKPASQPPGLSASRLVDLLIFLIAIGLLAAISLLPGGA